MKLHKRDWILIALIIAVLAAIVVSIRWKRPKIVPHDVVHLFLYQQMQSPIKSSRDAVGKGCANCHCVYAFPLPKDHPTKGECLSCHKMPQVTP